MTRREARASLEEAFATLDRIPVPNALAPRLYAGLQQTRRRILVRRLVAVALIGVVAVGGFIAGRETTIPANAPTAPVAPSVTMVEPRVVSVVRTGSAVLVTLTGLAPDRATDARLYVESDVKVPESVLFSADGSASLRFELPQEFGFVQPVGRIAIPLGSGSWTASIDLR